MPPVNGSTKLRRNGGSKPAQQHKPVPAIPLPYMKRSAAAAAAAVAAAAAAAASTDSHPVVEVKLTNGATTTATAKIEKDAKDISAAAQPAALPTSPVEAPNPAPPPAKQDVIQPRPQNGAQTNIGMANVSVKDDVADFASRQASTIAKADDSPKVAAVSNHADQPIVAPFPAQVQAIPIRSPNAVHKNANGVAAIEKEMKARQGHPAKARPPPAVSPTRYQMPPSFQPANRPMGVSANGDFPRHRPHLPNGPHMHQPQPSNGSIHFGTFHGSTSSSPAPPHSGGIAPPPGMSGPDGRPPYMGYAANGPHPMMPYGADMGPASFDGHGRPSMGYAPMDSYPPYGNNFGPSTPHSFHDSQSSAPPDDSGVYPQYTSGPVRNGVAAPSDDAQSFPGRMFNGPEPFRMMQNHAPPVPLIAQEDIGSMIPHLSQQFASAEFADCSLELRHAHPETPSMVIPAHRIVLSRSRELAVLMDMKSQEVRDGWPKLPSYVIETKSKWIRPEPFYTAIQRLYARPLLPIQPPPSVKGNEMADIALVMTRLDYALSYAAAGQLISWDSVTQRGCEIAIQYINWQTLERAVEFALDDHVDKGSHDNFKFGAGSQMVLDFVVAYIINNLPPNFALEPSVSEPENFHRFPATPTPSGSPSSQTSSAPAIAHGTSVHLAKPRRSRQITNIQFGDLPPFQAIVSRVLLNIPFYHLKKALENSGSNNANGWANAEYRYRVIKDVVAERERRRLQAVEAIQNGRVQGSESVLKQLSTPEPRYFDEWSALGWREEMHPFGNPDGPSLGRTWAPLEVQNGIKAEYP